MVERSTIPRAMTNVPVVLDAQTPLLLLPVRIETRFVDSAKGSELLVRIYPDQISIYSHDTELTATELSDGKAYWTVVWQSGNPAPNDSAIKAAWATLVRKYRPPRAAWVVLQTTPINLSDRPAAPSSEGSPPVFPSPPTREKSWNKPAYAVLLPDSWTIIAKHSQGTIVRQSLQISSDLAVTINPNVTRDSDTGGAFPPGSPVDAGMQWMVDFDVAENAGMAVRIPIDGLIRQNGFDTIFVYGLRTKGDSLKDLGALFDAHHYSDGLGFVPQGYPTKNTPDVAAEWHADESETSYAVEQMALPTPDPQADGSRLTTALGLDPSLGIFDRIAHSHDFSARNGTDMLTALWPSTIGYFLQQMMKPSLSNSQIDQCRRWTLDNLVARGPLSSLRVGNTPYGILPTSALHLYQNESESESSIVPFLLRLLQQLETRWVKSVSGSPQIATGDPDQDMLQVLGMEASSLHFYGRELLGPEFMSNWQNFIGLSNAARSEWESNYASLKLEAVKSFGFPDSWAPFLLGCIFNGDQFEIRFPTVSDKPLSETDTLEKDALVNGTLINYIDWLRTASVDDIRFERYPGKNAPSSILYKLLRQSILREYADIASRIEVAAGRLNASEMFEHELVNLSQNQPTTTPFSVLARPSEDNPSISWGEFLVQVQPPPESPYARIGELRTSLTRLSSLPTAELDRLMTETLDICSHRLDAWLTAMVSSLLKQSRSSEIKKLNIGAYSWVENVRPSAARNQVTGSEASTVKHLDNLHIQKTGISRSFPVPLEPHSDNGGYIHAPSYEQAAAAAILRAGYMTHKGLASDPLLSIDLSSERVARALWTLDGIRSGQRLSALLGYWFEFELESRSLQKYLQPFRDRFPLTGSDLTPTDPTSESVSASGIVDALALKLAFDSNQFSLGDYWGIDLPSPGKRQNPGQTQDDQSEIIDIMSELDDIMDAVSDLSISEAVFQITRGNFERSGGLLDAASRGSYAPDPQVINTQRSGIDITHRILILFSDVPVKDGKWSTIPDHARSIMEPSVDAWIGQLLPDPRLVRCSVSIANQGVIANQVVSLLDLNIGPLDFIALADLGQIPQQSELEQRINYYALSAFGPGSVAISFVGDTLPPDSITFPEALQAARSFRSLISASRPIQPKDLCDTRLNSATAGGNFNIAELQDRLNKVLARFDLHLATLQTLLNSSPTDLDKLRDAIFSCSEYGIGGSIPSPSNGPDASLESQGEAILKEMKKRRNSISQKTPATVDDIQSIVTILFNGTITVIPRVQAPNIAAMHEGFGKSDSLIPAGESFSPALWIQQLTHVRQGVSRLDFALMLSRLLNQTSYPPIKLAQLPPPSGVNGQNDRWLALPIDSSAPPESGRVVICAIASGDLTKGNDYAGFLVDEWPERIPAAKQSAAVSFHFEEPKAQAPQALLLAVCPDNRNTWDNDLIVATLEETLQLAKIRTVDLDSMWDVGMILPALYVPMNLKQSIIATRFRMNAAEANRFASEAGLSGNQ